MTPIIAGSLAVGLAAGPLMATTDLSAAGHWVLPSAAPVVAISGTASWYCEPGRSPCTRNVAHDRLAGAAGPALRAALGDGWRGATITVSHDGRSVEVELVDWCACYRGERLVDLYGSVWHALDIPLSRGLAPVEVTW